MVGSGPEKRAGKGMAVTAGLAMAKSSSGSSSGAVAAKGGGWELYDLSQDRAEQNDLSAKHPERVKRMAAAWDRQLEDAKTLAGD